MQILVKTIFIAIVIELKAVGEKNNGCRSTSNINRLNKTILSDICRKIREEGRRTIYVP